MLLFLFLFFLKASSWLRLSELTLFRTLLHATQLPAKLRRGERNIDLMYKKHSCAILSFMLVHCIYNHKSIWACYIELYFGNHAWGSLMLSHINVWSWWTLTQIITNWWQRECFKYRASSLVVSAKAHTALSRSKICCFKALISSMAFPSSLLCPSEEMKKRGKNAIQRSII